MSITTNCMTVNLHIGMWEGRRLDREAGKKIVRDADATDSEAVRVNKLIVPKDSFAEVTTARNKLRQHYLDHTLPWKDNGDRVLTRRMFPQFIPEHEALKNTFDDAASDYVNKKYLAAREQAEFRLGKLFTAGDYPSPGELRGKFYVTLEIDAVPEKDDFRVALDAGTIDTIKTNMEAAMKERVTNAMQDVYQRVFDTVQHFMSKTSDTDAIFRDSMVSNLNDLVEVLPGLNLLDDPNLKRIGKDIKASLAGYSAKDLRKDPKARQAAAAEAARIASDMQGFMNAFSHNGVA